MTAGCSSNWASGALSLLQRLPPNVNHGGRKFSSYPRFSCLFRLTCNQLGQSKFCYGRKLKAAQVWDWFKLKPLWTGHWLPWELNLWQDKSNKTLDCSWECIESWPNNSDNWWEFVESFMCKRKRELSRFKFDEQLLRVELRVDETYLPNKSKRFHSRQLSLWFGQGLRLDIYGASNRIWFQVLYQKIKDSHTL